jgi:hypothetical protein
MLEHPNQIILINARHRSEKDTCDGNKMGCAEFLRLEVFIKKGCDAKQEKVPEQDDVLKLKTTKN